MISLIPALLSSSTIHWTEGLLCTGSIALGITFESGRRRVPRPAIGIMAFMTEYLWRPLNLYLIPYSLSQMKMKEGDEDLSLG